jgi:hypothetical protein
MGISFKKVDGITKSQSNGYDVWELSSISGVSSELIGWYFVPEGVDGKDYYDALLSAESKLIALGLTDLEVKAIIGRQLF